MQSLKSLETTIPFHRVQTAIAGAESAGASIPDALTGKVAARRIEHANRANRRLGRAVITTIPDRRTRRLGRSLIIHKINQTGRK